MVFTLLFSFAVLPDKIRCTLLSRLMYAEVKLFVCRESLSRWAYRGVSKVFRGAINKAGNILFCVRVRRMRIISSF